MNIEAVKMNIENMIYVIRGHNVLLDHDLAKLYDVETRYLNKAVKRNILRFPSDFMFQLTDSEFESLKNIQGKMIKHGGVRKLPYAFTENGVAMLSSILNSDQAILVNITIMRIFTYLRKNGLFEGDLAKRINDLELGTNNVFKIVFEKLEEIEQCLEPTLVKERRKIGLLKK